MNYIQIFNNEQFGQVRVITKDGEPLFVAKDITDILGYSNTSDAIKKHVDDEEKDIAKCDTLGGSQNLLCVNESGLYSLVFGSKFPTAQEDLINMW